MAWSCGTIAGSNDPVRTFSPPITKRQLNPFGQHPRQLGLDFGAL